MYGILPNVVLKWFPPMMTWAKIATSKNPSISTRQTLIGRNLESSTLTFFFLEIIEWSNIFDTWSNHDEV